jgi:hypothetical protein
VSALPIPATPISSYPNLQQLNPRQSNRLHVCWAGEAVRGGDAVDDTGRLRSRLDLAGPAVYMAFKLFPFTCAVQVK